MYRCGTSVASDAIDVVLHGVVDFVVVAVIIVIAVAALPVALDNSAKDGGSNFTQCMIEIYSLATHSHKS